MSSIDEVKKTFEDFETAMDKTFPKVDKRLINEILHYMKKDPAPMYTLEVFLNEHANTDEIRNIISSERGVMPAFYDHGTHMVSAHRVTLELLQKIHNLPDVLRIRGTYTGGGRASIGPVFEMGDDEEFYSKKG